MTARLLALILRLYPRHYRRRFGQQWLRTGAELMARERGWRRARLGARLVGDALRALPDAYGRGAGSSSVTRALSSDALQALRALARRPRFTTTCVLVLSLGMGVNVAVFSVASAALLRPIDYADPERLVIAWGNWRAADFPEAPLSPPQLMALEESTDLFDSAGAVWATSVTLTGGEFPEQLSVGRATPSFFATLGVPPAMGRLLRHDDAVDPEAPDATGGVLLSHEYWRRATGSDSQVVGSLLRLDGVGYEVVGVLPERFRLFFPPGKGLPGQLDIYLAFPPLQFLNPDNFYLRAVARLRPDVDLATAARALEASAERLRGERADLADSDVVFALQNLQHQWTSDLRVGLLAVQAGALLLLLLTLTNVTSLMVAQAVDRLPSFAVRSCLGAGRARLLRQLAFEGGAMAVLAVGVGVGLGSAALAMMWRLRPGALQRIVDVGPDASVAAFALAVVVGSMALLSVGPMLLLWRTAAARVLTGRAGNAGNMAGARMRRLAAVVQIGSAFALLVGASLLSRSVANLQRVEIGYATDNRLTLTVGLPLGSFPADADRWRVVREIRAGIEELPGVEAVGAGSHLPLGRWVNWAGPVLPVESPGDPAQQGIVDHRAITPGYFRALGAAFVAGREFDSVDSAEGAAVAVVDRTLARRLAGDGSALGRQVEVGVYRDFRFQRVVATIVGVVEPLRDRAPDLPSTGQVYVPFAQSARWEIGYVVHAERPVDLVDPIRRLVAGVSPELAAANLHLLGDDRDAALGPARFAWLLSVVVAAAASVLSAVGIFGVLALETRRRAHEIGVRLALGADVAQVFRMVLSTGARLAALGVAVGAPLAFGFSLVLRASLYGVGAFEALAYLPAALTILLLGALATAIPARRATRLDPATSLRSGGE